MKMCRYLPFFLFAAAASAHSELGNYVQHRVILGTAPDHIDLTIEIAFDGEHSLAERRAIDADGNGVFSKDERAAYLQTIEASCDTAIKLAVNGKPVRLVPLYSPKLDLLDSQELDRHPHVLRLSFFAKVKCAPGDALTVTDSLWPNSPAIMLAESQGDSDMKATPREAPLPDVAADAKREVVFDLARVEPAPVKSTAHVCTAACRHGSPSKGRPGGHRN